MTASYRQQRHRDGIGKRRDVGWLRAAWAASLLVLCLYAAAPVAADDGDLFSPAAPLCLPSGPGEHLHPTIAIDRQGNPVVAWVQRLPRADDSPGEAEVRMAQAPSWAPVTVAVTSPDRAAALRPLLVAGEATHLIWTEPSTTATVTVWQYTHGTGQAPQAWSEAAPSTAVVAADAEGRLQALWVQEDGLVLIDGTATFTSSLTLDLTVSPADLVLALDASRRPHAAWAGQRQVDQGAAIYYAALDADAVPTLIAEAGHAPRLAVGPLGTVHLCWHSADGLACADSRDWGRMTIVAPGVPDERVALAVGPNDVAHLAWSADGALWYANSGDWAASRRRLTDLAATQLSMAIDSAGRPYIAATAETDDAGAQGNALFILAPFSVEPQLAIAAPAGAGWLAEGDSLVAVANLPVADWQRIAFYLQPDPPPSAAPEDALIPIGTDYDGRDGWSVPFEGVPLDVSVPYRVVAVGVDVRGGVTSAVGEPVTVLAPGDVEVWVLNAGPEIIHGQGEVLVMTPGVGADLAFLEVLFTAPGCPSRPPPGEPPCSIPPRTYVVASLAPASSVGTGQAGSSNQAQGWAKVRPDREWLPVAYDSRTLPDGTYRVSAVATDRDGREHVGVAAGTVTIDNELAPTVRVSEPRPGAVVWGTFRAAVEALGTAASLRWVDFYGERQRTLLQCSEGGVRQTVKAPDVVWLGSDTDGSDGWSIAVTADELLDGDAWVLRAVAHDDRGRSAVARSEGTFAIVGTTRPALQFALPAPGSELVGVVPVSMRVVVGSQQVAGVDLYAETHSGRLIPLGEMEERAGRWVHEWNTVELLDGDYGLVAIVRRTDGRLSLVRGGSVAVRNASDGYRFVEPESGTPLGGAVAIRLLRTAEGEQASTITLYWRDVGGQLRLIGPAAPSENGWTIVWDTASVLPGAYDLVAVVRGPGDRLHYVEQQVVLDGGLRASLVTWPAEGDVVSGTLPLAWQVAGEARVALDWSPDGGVHWIPLADGLDADGAYEWNTAQQPDTPQAMLRLSAGRDVRRTVAQAGPFTISNANEAPSVALLAPEPGAAHGSPLFVAWQAWDADGDPVLVDLDYRRGLGGWQPLVRGVAGARFFSWNTAALEPAGDYALLVTVRDPTGAAA